MACRPRRRPTRTKTSPVGSGRCGCIGFPATQEIARNPSEAYSTSLADSSGFSQRSIQGTRPFLLNVRRYQATYAKHAPTRPIIPLEKLESSQGPLGATPITKASRSSSPAATAYGFHCGSFWPPMKRPGRAAVMMYCSHLRYHRRHG